MAVLMAVTEAVLMVVTDVRELAIMSVWITVMLIAQILAKTLVVGQAINL